MKEPLRMPVAQWARQGAWREAAGKALGLFLGCRRLFSNGPEGQVRQGSLARGEQSNFSAHERPAQSWHRCFWAEQEDFSWPHRACDTLIRSFWYRHVEKATHSPTRIPIPPHQEVYNLFIVCLLEWPSPGYKRAHLHLAKDRWSLGSGQWKVCESHTTLNKKNNNN